MFKLSEDDGTFPHNTYVKMGSVHQRYSKHVMFFNILIGKEHERAKKKKKQLQLNKSVSLWLLCCLFAAARALRFNMFGLNYLFPPGKQPSCVLNVYMD